MAKIGYDSETGFDDGRDDSWNDVDDAIGYMYYSGSYADPVEESYYGGDAASFTVTFESSFPEDDIDAEKIIGELEGSRGRGSNDRKDFLEEGSLMMNIHE